MSPTYTPVIPVSISPQHAVRIGVRAGLHRIALSTLDGLTQTQREALASVAQRDDVNTAELYDPPSTDLATLAEMVVAKRAAAAAEEAARAAEQEQRDQEAAAEYRKRATEFLAQTKDETFRAPYVSGKTPIYDATAAQFSAAISAHRSAIVAQQREERQHEEAAREQRKAELAAKLRAAYLAVCPEDADRVAAGFVSRNEMRDALERAHLVDPLSQLGITAVQETPGNSVRLLNSLTRHQFALFEKIKAALPTASVEAQLFSAENDEDETIKTISVVLDMHGLELSVWVVLE